MIRLDGATVLLQWSAGGWLFLWATTRRREVGLGYGWIQRILFLALTGGSLAAAFVTSPTWPREIATMAFASAGAVALAVALARRRAGVAVGRETAERRTARVAAMTGIDTAPKRFDAQAPEFPPAMDLVAALLGLAAVLVASLGAGGPAVLSVLRGLTSALFLGLLSDAMLLGHWYLVQPGLRRAPLLELLRWAVPLWALETVSMLLPTGMVSVLNGSIDDAYNGLLGWFWIACVLATIGLTAAARAALRERAYSAVMATTGLLYLAILTGFGQDLVPRVLLAP